MFLGGSLRPPRTVSASLNCARARPAPPPNPATTNQCLRSRAASGPGTKRAVITISPALGAPGVRSAIKCTRTRAPSAAAKPKNNPARPVPPLATLVPLSSSPQSLERDHDRARARRAAAKTQQPSNPQKGGGRFPSPLAPIPSNEERDRS